MAFLPIKAQGLSIKAMLNDTSPGAVAARIERAIKLSGIKVKTLADACGVAVQAVYRWPKDGLVDKTRFPVISQLTGYRVEWLMSGELPEKLDFLILQSRRIPIFTNADVINPEKAFDAFNSGDGINTVFVDAKSAKELGPVAFAYLVDGDSLSPDIKAGDVVIIDPDVPPLPGDYVAANINRTNTLSLMKYRDRGVDANGNHLFELIPTNPDYPTIRAEESIHCRIIGVVHQRITYYRRARSGPDNVVPLHPKTPAKS